VDFSPFLVNHGIAGPPHPEKAYRHVGIGRFPVDDNPVSQDLAQRQRENQALRTGDATSTSPIDLELSDRKGVQCVHVASKHVPLYQID